MSESESDIARFEAQVNEYIKMLGAPDAATRRRAAIWLGEAGDPKAITRLKQVYQGDEDPRVRAHAAYSLGMFRALEEALADDRRKDRAMQLIEDITLRGKMGRRTRIPAGCLVRLLVALLTSLVILLAFNFVIWPMLDPDAANRVAQVPAAAADRATVLSELDALAAAVRADSLLLREKYAAVQGGAQIDCAGAFANPVTYDAARAADADLSAIAVDLNTAVRDMTIAKAPFNAACGAQPTPVTAEQVGGPLASLDATLALLDQTAAALTAARGVLQSPAADTTAPVAPTTEPQAVEPTPLPVITQHLNGLYTIVDDVRGARGAATLLEQYWNDVRSSGGTGGCTQPAPLIPGDYTVPPDAIAAAPNLELASGLVNTGLGLLRLGWAEFQAACAAGPAASLNRGLELVNNINQAFNGARSTLDALRQG